MNNMDRTAAFYSRPSYVGAGFPVYSGSRRQRGGSILGSIAKFALPMLKNVGRAALGQAVGLAKDVAHDTLSGQNIRESFKRRGIQRLKKTVTSTLGPRQKQPSRKRKAQHKKQPVKKRRRVLF